MDDTPGFLSLQQACATPRSGAELEAMGKQAAAAWGEGTYKTLHDAVVMVVKTAGLSPEQVRRVVEFTNASAYQSEFTKAGSVHKYVDFGAGGPANPSQVLQDLNDGGGGSVFDSGSDYDFAPAKVASEQDVSFFGTSEGSVIAPDPLREAVDLHSKLASRVEHLAAQHHGLSGMLQDLAGNLAEQTKQAALDGHPLSEVVYIWENFTEDPDLVKAAFQVVLEPLLESRVFYSTNDVVASLEKQASAAGSLPDPNHPLASTFREFTEVLSKLAEVDAELHETREGCQQLQDFLRKEAAKGILPQAAQYLHQAAAAMGRGGEAVGNVLLGAGKGRGVGTAAKALTYAAPAIVGYEAYRRNLKYNPGFQSAKRTAFSVVPGTQEHYNKELELQSQNPYAMMGGY